MAMASRTYLDKAWQDHVIEAIDAQADLVWIDRHFTHDLSGPFSMKSLKERDLSCRRPDLTFAVPDHGVSTEPGRSDATSPASQKFMPPFRRGAEALGIKMFDLDSPHQGIVHVTCPELGLCLPGAFIVCGDSHTCTQGGLGSIAWGIGNTEVTQVFATQTLILQKPKNMRVRFEGACSQGVGAKDMILALIAREGADGGTGYAIEFAGQAVEELSVAGRMTLCNLTIEFGARIGFVAPDTKTFSFLKGRQYAPNEGAWNEALSYWKTLRTDADARFDRELVFHVDGLQPQISWGTSPEHTVGIGEAVPDPSQVGPAKAKAWNDAMEYMDLTPGQRLCGLPIDHVFVGSCTNSRVEDLEAAADLLRGRRIADGVSAWVVPGSQAVKREAEQRGLRDVFESAGFSWREPGCSRCMAMNGEVVPPGERCVSTTNRNFVGRQGPGARTHLASPTTAAACALRGVIADPRDLMRGLF